MTTQAANSSEIATRPLHPAITTDVNSFEAAARAAERVEVILQSPTPEHRTKLMAFVLSSIEAQLERLGAAPAGYGPRDSLETSLSDQLYRSRLLGAGGIALRFTDLDGIADSSGSLSVEDSYALRRMFAFAELEPLQVLLPEQSARLHVQGAPQRLREWLPEASLAGRVAQIEYEAAAAPSSLPPPSAEQGAAGLAPPDLAAFLDTPVRSSEATSVCSSAPPEVAAAAATAPSAELNEHERPTVVPAVAPTDPQAAAAPTPAPMAAADAAERTAAAATRTAAAATCTAAAATCTAEERAEQQRRCAAWLAQLRSMNGPKQHASVERAFVTAYLPLAREVASGNADEELRAAVDSWAEGFAHSYASAFKTLTGHARRPTMVRDIFDVALRWLTQYRARSCELLLVDCMRFDLGQRLNEELERRLAGHGVCRDQTLLWAALPSNSVAQRLAENGGQRSTPPGKARPAQPEPGIEPLRVGARELFRLDRLSAELGRPGEAEPLRLERLAKGLAEQIAPWLKSLPPDTLVIVFGDHGFHWRADERGTSVAQRGGALPEQVLVPASAWLLGSPRSKPGTAPGLH